MKTFSIRIHPMIRLSDRFDPAQEGFPMLWSAASAERNVRGASLEVQISCTYHEYKPSLSFEVDEPRVPGRAAHGSGIGSPAEKEMIDCFRRIFDTRE